MPNPKVSYEVEIRFYFNSYQDACEKLSFLQESFQTVDWWDTGLYGLELFHADQMLRIGYLLYEDNWKKSYLGWKGPDIGDFANIRSEIDEDITDGIENSIVLAEISGSQEFLSSDAVIKELNRLGHEEFMSFSGKNTLGRYEPLDIGVKLMSCSQLKYPLMVEIEKTASTEEEARLCEIQLYEISRELNLLDQLVKKSLLTCSTNRFMADNKRIHIFGASGAGTTTLGLCLAESFTIPHLDTDDYFWEKTDIPHTRIRELKTRTGLLKTDLEKHQEWVLSGSLCGWGDFAIPMFTFAVFLWVPQEIRLERLRERELERFGQEALAPGGWFHENHTGFMEWAAQYDAAGPEMRSRALHEEWMKTLPCRLVRFEQPLNVDIMAAQIQEYL